MGSAGPLMRLRAASKSVSLVANVLERRSMTLDLDFDDSLEGCQTKNHASGLTLVD